MQTVVTVNVYGEDGDELMVQANAQGEAFAGATGNVLGVELTGVNRVNDEGPQQWAAVASITVSLPDHLPPGS